MDWSLYRRLIVLGKESVWMFPSTYKSLRLSVGGTTHAVWVLLGGVWLMGYHDSQAYLWYAFFCPPSQWTSRSYYWIWQVITYHRHWSWQVPEPHPNRQRVFGAKMLFISHHAAFWWQTPRSSVQIWSHGLGFVTWMFSGDCLQIFWSSLDDVLWLACDKRTYWRREILEEY